MGLMIYGSGDHGAGFIGVRIAKMIDCEHRQKYFNFRNAEGHASKKEQKEIIKKAQKLLDQWENEHVRLLRAQKVGTLSTGRRVSSTLGARGITASFSTSINQQGKKYYHPTITVRGGNIKYKSTFFIRTQGYDEAYKQALKDYVARHSLSPYHKKKLQKYSEPHKAFENVRLRVNKKGYNITTEQMIVWGIPQS